jgi:hypothetical protein
MNIDLGGASDDYYNKFTRELYNPSLMGYIFVGDISGF